MTGVQTCALPIAASLKVRELTGGMGADLSIEAVGIPPTMDDALAATRRAGRIVIAGSVDLDAVLSIAQRVKPAPPVQPNAPNQLFKGLRIGIAKDVAFGFYYPDDLETFTDLGAELIPFDTLNSPALPNIDGLFIGGGFPEMQMAALAANQPLRDQIKAAINAGLALLG